MAMPEGSGLMSLRPDDCSVAPDDPFKHDLLDRRSQADLLVELAQQNSGGLVVAVDGKFGSGKSTFLKMCAAQLRLTRPELKVVEFNAWQQSHTNNPLIDLTSKLLREVPGSDKRELLWTAVKRVSWNAVTLATQGLVDSQVIHGSDDTEPAQPWNDIEDQRQKFRNALGGLAKEQPLVVLLDELDRCMPQQALDYLNVVRHLFDVAGVTVVVGVNQTELAHRVRCLYGDTCEADVFLRRFRDVTMPLRPPTDEQLVGFLNGVFHDARLPTRFSSEPVEFDASFWMTVVEQTGMSLRDIQQSVRCFANVTSSADPDSTNALLGHLVLAAFVLRKVDRDTYNKLISKKYSVFKAAANLRTALAAGDDVWWMPHLAALVLSLDFGIGRSDDDPVPWTQRVVDAGLGDKTFANEVLRVRQGMGNQLFNVQPSLERIDRLLDLAP